MKLKQRDKERVIKLIQEARFLALCDRPSEELFKDGLGLELSPEDQLIVDQLTNNDILSENEWLKRINSINVEDTQKMWEESQAEQEDDWRFDPEPLDDDILFRSN